MDAQTISIFTAKMVALGPLSAEEQAAVNAVQLNVRDVGRDQDLVREGEHSPSCILLVEGFACRYRTLSDGRRQILSFHIPGDFMDLPGYLLEWLDHGIATLTPSKIALVAHATIDELMEHPAIARALWLDTLIDGAMHREWIVNVGRRTAYQRVAHILCELMTRLQAAGLARDGVCDLPITQGELADATGLSTVHVNRVIQELRRDGLISLRGRSLAALDWDGLQRAAEANPAYLELVTKKRTHAG